MTPEEKIREIKNRYSGRIRIAVVKVARELIQPIIDVVRLRTRQEGEGTKGKLQSLKPSTVENRLRNTKRLHPDTTPSTSNLTATGQLLDSLKGTAGGGVVKVFANKNKRKKELNGLPSSLTNDQVRAYVEQDREFLKLSSQEKKEVSELATKLLNEELRTLLK